MTFRLIPQDDDFNLPDFDHPFIVSAVDGLARSQLVVAPPGQKYDLEFGTTDTETRLGRITIRNDGGFKYVPDRPSWDNDRERIDRVEYWVKVRGRAIRTTGRFAIRQGWSKQDNGHVASVRENSTPSARYLLDGGAYDPERVANWLYDFGHDESGSRLVILSASKSSDEGAYVEFQKRSRPRWGMVQSFVVNTAFVANASSVSHAIDDATAIFIEGGDQTKYWSVWNGTKLQEALGRRVGKVPIGGSSAGMAILGGEIYLPSIVEDGVGSAEAMSNPRDVFPRSRFSGNAFLEIPFFKGVYLETHFKARKRLGRTSAILAMSNTADRAIMAEEGAALSIDDKGLGTVVGNDRLYFAKLTTPKPRPRANWALTTGDIEVVAAGEKQPIQPRELDSGFRRRGYDLPRRPRHSSPERPCSRGMVRRLCAGDHRGGYAVTTTNFRDWDSIEFAESRAKEQTDGRILPRMAGKDGDRNARAGNDLHCRLGQKPQRRGRCHNADR